VQEGGRVLWPIGSGRGAVLQPVLLVGRGGVGDCFPAGTTVINLPVGSPVLAERKQAWMAVRSSDVVHCISHYRRNS
jgi:hypothetical protein